VLRITAPPIDGESAELGAPAAAREHGVPTVYQDLSLIDTMDVASNLFLAREIRRRPRIVSALGFVSKKAMYRRTQEILDTLKIRIPSIRQPVAVLSGGQRQAVALGRAVAWGKHIILLDEPEAALGVEQAEFMLQLIATLSERGLALLFVSHNMTNVMRVTDKVVVLRQGVACDAVRRARSDPVAAHLGACSRRPLVGLSDVRGRSEASTSVDTDRAAEFACDRSVRPSPHQIRLVHDLRV
jgi:ABC-type sugar transport system ATPase subunit